MYLPEHLKIKFEEYLDFKSNSDIELFRKRNFIFDKGYEYLLEEHIAKFLGINLSSINKRAQEYHEKILNKAFDNAINKY